MEANLPTNAAATDAQPAIDSEVANDCPAMSHSSVPVAEDVSADDESSSSSSSSSDSDEGDAIAFNASDYSDDEPMTDDAPMTRNELPNPPPTLPPITHLPSTATLHPLGHVHAHVDSSLTIRGAAPGVTRVLDVDTLVALEDRRVVGVIAEVFGPVAQPMYSVRFASPEEARGVGVGERVYYAEEWARAVETGRLRLARGTDASNIYDEEVGEEQMEFSDDEEERAAKQRRRKGRRAEPEATAAAAAGAPSVAGRKLQSYGDLFDADLGF
ncbi:hypothetical protein GGI15_000422 [Coemansia interrupta]|uniref:H/ACA ribonucleoprotein complex subunit n=1 Tax=Coemansia interrupta TaxID=1126814 RepID=A0A9W8HLA2_9FUNG|nr:hypothetical protein GGI15_000422 [Coemansia interrupta]